eukprot:scaffold11024_cov60-Phaeocystis_antarctica.AAC.1
MTLRWPSRVWAKDVVAGQALTAARAAATRHTLPPRKPPRPAAPRARRSPRHTRASAAHRRRMPPGSAAAPRRPVRALSVCRSRDRRSRSYCPTIRGCAEDVAASGIGG